MGGVGHDSLLLNGNEGETGDTEGWGVLSLLHQGDMAAPGAFLGEHPPVLQEELPQTMTGFISVTGGKIRLVSSWWWWRSSPFYHCICLFFQKWGSGCWGSSSRPLLSPYSTGWTDGTSCILLAPEEGSTTHRASVPLPQHRMTCAEESECLCSDSLVHPR